jgi:hypothetical protein
MRAMDNAMPNPIATLTTARLLAEAIISLHFNDLRANRGEDVSLEERP